MLRCFGDNTTHTLIDRLRNALVAISIAFVLLFRSNWVCRSWQPVVNGKREMWM